MVTVAFANGRLVDDSLSLFQRAGLAVPTVPPANKLLFCSEPNSDIRCLFVKPSDVTIYVSRGVADYGVVGRDILDESRLKFHRILDLNVGTCRLSLAGPPDKHAAWQNCRHRSGLVVASRYPRTARRHLGRLGVKSAVLALSGAVEVAACTGLADVIVDLVATGRTLAAHGLIEYEVLEPRITAWLVTSADAEIRKNCIILKALSALSS